MSLVCSATAAPPARCATCPARKTRLPQATAWDMRLPGTIRLMSVMVESSASVALPLLLIAVRPHNTRNDARMSGQFKAKGGTLFSEKQDSMNDFIGTARHPSPYSQSRHTANGDRPTTNAKTEHVRPSRTKKT